VRPLSSILFIDCQAVVQQPHETGLAIWALDMALALGQPPEGCIHLTDCGSHCCFNEYQLSMSKYMFKASMSGKGNYYNNSMVKTFFKSNKAELIWRKHWEKRRQAEGHDLPVYQWVL
jgi:putative transposase